MSLVALRAVALIQKGMDMNILYTCDNNYIWLMGISMISLFENNRNTDCICVYLLGDRISASNQDILHDIADKYDRKVIIIDVPTLDIPELLVSKRWPASAFTRLFSGNLLPKNVNSVIYLDCDTIVVGDISALKNIDISNATFFGVKDCVGGTYKMNIGLDKDCVYINAGVLIINLEELRRKDISKLIEQYVEKYTKFISYADQDILNGVFFKDIKTIDPKFDVMTITSVYTFDEINILRKPTNYYSKIEFEDAVREPSIIHYTTNMRTIRPWYSNTNHPFSTVFMKYLNISPWKNAELKEFRFTTKESKIIQAIQYLPKNIGNRILGTIHSELKPRYIRMKAKLHGF